MGRRRKTLRRAAGRALPDIQRRELYRPHYKSFEEYLRLRWEMGTRYAFSLIRRSR